MIAGLTYVDVDCPDPLSSDYGDAPDSYGSICYYIDDANPTRLGATVDSDDNFQSSANADGDDNDGNNDDDGVTFANPSGLTAGASESVTVTWSTNDQDSYISAWIDFNQNGTFDANEKVIDDFEQGAFNNTSTGSEPFTFTVPADAACGTTFARFIITSDPNEGPTGDFCNSGNTSDDGEVEDYQVTILSGLSVDAGADETFCGSQVVQLSANVTGGDGNYTYQWDNGAGTTANPTVSVNTTTTFSVTVTDGNSCTATDATMIEVEHSDVTVDDNIPVCTNTFSYDLCITGKALSHFVVGLPDCLNEDDVAQVLINGQNYGSWSVGFDPPCMVYGLKFDGLSLDDDCATFTIIFNESYATETGTWNAKAGTCCSEGQATVPSCQSGTPAEITGDDLICEGTTTVLTASSGDTYEWSNGAITPEITVGPGTYSVTVTEAGGCTGEATFVVSAAELPVVEAGNDASICVGGNYELTATASAGTPPYTFSWSDGLGDGATKTVSPPTDKTYTVTVTDANSCTDTDQVTITVTPAPQLSLTSMCWQDGDINGTHVMRTRNENDFAIDFDVYYSGGLQKTYTIPANSEYFFPVPDVNSVTIKWTPDGCGEQSTTKALN
ncbi:MAG: GEVED domain-containing protein, partial [Planctomycetota bacterium]